MGSRENCSSKGRFSYCSRSHSKYTFHEGCLSEQGDEEQQTPTEQNKNSEQQDPLKLPWSHIKMKKPLLKGTRWSKMMLLQGSQPCRRVVLRQFRETETNCRVIIRLPAMRLSNNQTQWYRGKRCGRAMKRLLATKRRKFLLSFLQHQLKTKDLIQGNPYSHGMCKRGTGMPRVVPKR